MEEIQYPLQRKWAIWEMWDQSPRFSGNSLENMQIVGEFQGVHEFWQHWNYLPHANPRTLFENPETKVKIVIEPLNQSIEAIGLFEDKIKPIFTDVTTKNSSRLYFDLNVENIDKLKDVWDKLVFSLIGETIACGEEILGAKVVDYKKFYRIEVWCRFDASLTKFSNKASQIKDSIRDILGVSEINVATHSNT